MDQHVDAVAAWRGSIDRAAPPTPASREVDRVVVDAAAGSLDRLAWRPGRRRLRSMRASSRSTSTGVARSPAACSRSKIVRFRPSLSVVNASQVGVARIGLGHQVEQVEGALAGPGQVRR